MSLRAKTLKGARALEGVGADGRLEEGADGDLGVGELGADVV
jgi:hypothetical protein